jgi:hypothetical protein
LNKHYEENEYLALRERIIRQMNEMPYIDKKGRIYRYGEFFPVELSPFPYNATTAQRFFPLTEKETIREKYAWESLDRGKYAITVKSTDLPDHIKDASEKLLEEVIGCASCGGGFKIIAMKLDFLRKMNLPLSRTCPQCRIEEKFDQWVKNLRMIGRTCDQCGAAFTTKYTKEEAPRILCKECYLKEVI